MIYTLNNQILLKYNLWLLYNNGHTTEFDLTIAGTVWFDVSSVAEYGYGKAFPAGDYTALITAECIAQ